MRGPLFSITGHRLRSKRGLVVKGQLGGLKGQGL